MTEIVLADPSDQALVTLDWSDVLPGAVTLVSVTHTVPSPLTKLSEATDSGNSASQVKISGGVHGALYLIEAQGLFSNGESLNRQFPLRVFNG